MSHTIQNTTKSEKIYYREPWLWFGFYALVIVMAIFLKHFVLMTVMAISLLITSVLYNLTRPKRKGNERNI
jgi:hypothetical protein